MVLGAQAKVGSHKQRVIAKVHPSGFFRTKGYS
jgi:hypothetical protein